MEGDWRPSNVDAFFVIFGKICKKFTLPGVNRYF